MANLNKLNNEEDILTNKEDVPSSHFNDEEGSDGVAVKTTKKNPMSIAPESSPSDVLESEDNVIAQGILDTDKSLSNLLEINSNYVNLIGAISKKYSGSHGVLLSSMATQAQATLNYFNSANIDPDDLETAEKNNLPLSLVSSKDPVVLKCLEDMGMNNKLDINLNTPVVFKYLNDNEIFAAKLNRCVADAQKAEILLSTDNNHSDSIWDNVKYTSAKVGYTLVDTGLNVGKATIKGAEAIANTSLYTTDYVIRNTPLRHLTNNYYNKPLDLHSDRLDAMMRDIDSLSINMAKSLEDMPHEKEALGTLKKDGVIAFLSYLVKNPLSLVNLGVQELGPLALGGAVGKGVSGTSKVVKTAQAVIGAGVRSYSSSLASNMVEEANKTPADPYGAAYNARKKTGIDAAVGSVVGQFNPFKTRWEVFNTIGNNVVQQAITYPTTAFLNGEKISMDEFSKALASNIVLSLGGVFTSKNNWSAFARDVNSKRLNASARFKIVKENPRAYTDILNLIKKNEMVYVEANRFAEVIKSNKNNLLAEFDPKIKTALAGDGFVRLSYGEYIVNVIQHVDAKLLENDIKSSPNALTPNEQKVLTKKSSAYTKELDTQSERLESQFKQYEKEYKKLGVDQPEQHASLKLFIEESFKNLDHSSNFSFSESYNVRIDNHHVSDITKKSNKSFISFSDDGHTVTVNINKSVGLNQFVVESSKLHIKGLEKMASSGNVEASKNIQIIKKYFNTGDLSSISVKEEKKFTSELVNYLNTGKLKNLDMKPVFDSYRQWSVDFYSNFKEMNHHLGEDLIDGFDALSMGHGLSNSIIKAPYTPLFESGQISVEKYAQYEALSRESLSAVNDKVYKNYNAESINNAKKAWEENKKRIEKEEAVKENGMTVYQVRDFLIKGKLKDGGNGPIIKLDETDLVRHYGKKALDKLPNLTQKNGVSLKHVADLWNYRSIDNLVNDLANSIDKRANISNNVNLRMHKEYGDIYDVKHVLKEGRKALEISGGRANMLAFEQKELLRLKLQKESIVLSSKELNNSIASDGVIALQVDALLKKNNKEFKLDPNSFLIKMQLENQKAYDAFKQGDLKEALQAKELERYYRIFYLRLLEKNKIQDNKLSQVINRLKIKNEAVA